MSRTLKYKIAYPILIVAAVGIIAVVVHLLNLHWLLTLFLLGLVLIVPGRVGGYFLKDLFLARKLIADEKPEEAIEASDRMLATLKREPWRQRFMYCFYNFYTWDARALLTNNMGACQLMMGQLDQGEKTLKAAIKLDEKNPMPYYNLAIVEHVRGNAEEGERLFSIARDYGYTASNTEQLISKVGVAYARYQTVP